MPLRPRDVQFSDDDDDCSVLTPQIHFANCGELALPTLAARSPLTLGTTSSRGGTAPTAHDAKSNSHVRMALFAPIISEASDGRSAIMDRAHSPQLETLRRMNALSPAVAQFDSPRDGCGGDHGPPDLHLPPSVITSEMQQQVLKDLNASPSVPKSPSSVVERVKSAVFESRVNEGQPAPLSPSAFQHALIPDELCQLKQKKSLLLVASPHGSGDGTRCAGCIGHDGATLHPQVPTTPSQRPKGSRGGLGSSLSISFSSAAFDHSVGGRSSNRMETSQRSPQCAPQQQQCSTPGGGGALKRSASATRGHPNPPPLTTTLQNYSFPSMSSAKVMSVSQYDPSEGRMVSSLVGSSSSQNLRSKCGCIPLQSAQSPSRHSDANSTPKVVTPQKANHNHDWNETCAPTTTTTTTSCFPCPPAAVPPQHVSQRRTMRIYDEDSDERQH